MKKAPSGACARAAILTCATLCATLPAHAAKTWTGATDANWTTLTNWQEGALPVATENIVFNASSLANLTINTGANQTVLGIVLSNPAGPVTIQNNTFTIGSNGINVSAATQNLNIASPTTILRSGAFHWDVPAGRTLTFAGVPHRNSPATGFGGGNNDNIGGVVRVATTGTVNLTTPNLLVVSDAIAAGGQGGNNPYMTYGDNAFAATDATGNVIAATNVPWNASVGTAFSGSPGAVAASFTQSGNGGFQGIVFDDATTAHVLTLGNGTTFTGRAVLMTSTCVGGTITGANLRPNRSNTGGATFSFIQNSTLGDLVIGSSLGNASSNTPVAITKSGPGKMVLTGANGYTGRTFIHEGTLQIGDGGTIGSLSATSSNIINNAALIINRSDALALANVISGTGTITKTGTGTVTFGAANTYTGTTTVTGGLISISTAASLGATPSLLLDGGGIQWTAPADISTLPITFGAGGVTFDAAAATSVVLASPVGNSGAGSLTKTGAGTISLGAANLYSGGTTISGGTLLATNLTGSATGSGAVSVQSGGGIGGTGTISGTVTVDTGAKVSPGASVGTLTVGGLSLGFGSSLDIEFGASNDKVIVTNPGALAIGGGALTLLQEGTTNAFAAAGTYQLIGYSGSIVGTPNALSVANPQPGFTYNFGTAGGFVTLTIGTTGAVRNWVTNGDGSWANSTNWNGTFPNATGATANFNVNLSAPATVTLDGAKTVGAITFLSGTNGYTIAQGSGGSLTLNNGLVNSAVLDGAGSHTISVPLVLATNTIVDTTALTDSMTLSGAISGTGKLTKTGPGSLSLLSSNTFNGAVTLSGGTTTFATGGLGSGALTMANSNLVWAPGNSQDISNRVITFDTGIIGFNTNGNDVTLANDIGNSGFADLIKSGEGKLTLGADNTYSGLTTISGGILQLGTGGATGSVTGDIVNNGSLILNHAGPFPLIGAVSGTGSLVHAGTGVLELLGASTFSGPTSITNPAASIALVTGTALQNSTLNYLNSGGSVTFESNATATFGALDGDRNLDLTNKDLLAVGLTVGGNNETTIYTGVLSGAGFFTKNGTGTMTLTKPQTYTGATFVGGGILTLPAGSSISGTTVSTGTNAQLLIDGGSVTSSAFSTIQSGTSGLRLNSGSVAYNGGLQSSQNDNTQIEIFNGTFTALDVVLRRTQNYGTAADPVPAAAGNNGLVVNGGIATITNILQVGTGNSSASALVNGGSLSVGGVVNVGNTSNGRWNIFEVRAGSFVSSEATQGLLLSPNATTANRAQFLVSGGTATVERIGFGTATSANTATGRVTVSSGTLYVGAGGMVQDGIGYTSQVQLNGGTLAAKADWGSSLPITTANTFTIQAADASNAAHSITLSGGLSGTGSLLKTGPGTLTLGGTNTYTGNTDIDAGTVSLAAPSLSDTATLDIAATGVLHLTHSQSDTVAVLILDGVTKGPGTYTAANSGGRITGTGSITVPGSDPFGPWIAGYPTLTGDAALKGSDPDGDGYTNLEEFAFNSVPNNGTSSGKIRARIETVGSEQALVLTIPVRDTASFDNIPGPGLDATVDKVAYTVQGSNNLQTPDQTIVEIPVSSANMPNLDAGWTYRSFRLTGPIGGATPRGPKGFITATAVEVP